MTYKRDDKVFKAKLAASRDALLRYAEQQRIPTFWQKPSVWQTIKTWWAGFVKQHIVNDYPYSDGFAHKPLIRRVFLCSLLGFCAVVLLTLEAACSKSLPSGHFVVNVRPSLAKLTLPSVFAKYTPLQNANYNQSEGKYSEDKIAYYLCCFGVSLIPVGILIVVGAHIYFWGDRCFRFLGDLLVFGGLAYLGLCALVLGVLRVVWN